jgi:hypothetical protein
LIQQWRWVASRRKTYKWLVQLCSEFYLLPFTSEIMKLRLCLYVQRFSIPLLQQAQVIKVSGSNIDIRKIF